MPPPPSTALREHVRARAEDRPGIYRMWDAEDRIVYVGKSVRVRTRLLSYFRGPRGEKPAQIVAATSRITWEYVPNEFSALLREMRLIREWRPRFNVEHRGRPRWAFVKLTREPAPRLVPVGRIVPDGSAYFGPFSRVRWMAESVRVLSHVLGLRDCPAATPVWFGDQMELFGAGGRTPLCMRADLNTCLAPCCGRTTAAEYGERVRGARRFLEGRGRLPLELVEQRMAEAARRLDFEYAALLRDRAEHLHGFRDELVALRGEVDALSFVYRVPGFRGADRLYLIRGGRVRGEVDHPKSGAARREVARRMEAVFGPPEPAHGALSPETASEVLLVTRWFRQRPKERKRAIDPERWLEEKDPERAARTQESLGSGAGRP